MVLGGELLVLSFSVGVTKTLEIYGIIFQVAPWPTSSLDIRGLGSFPKNMPLKVIQIVSGPNCTGGASLREVILKKAASFWTFSKRGGHYGQ